MINVFDKSMLVLNLDARVWCKTPYYNHPKGCPNFGKRATCPPEAPLFENFIDIEQEMILVAVRFDLGEHVEKMRQIHPDWSYHQLRCVLYWQGKVRKELRGATQQVLSHHREMISTDCPEAMGVDVIETAKRWFPDILRIPKDVAYKIAICGYPAKKEVT